MTAATIDELIESLSRVNAASKVALRAVEADREGLAVGRHAGVGCGTCQDTGYLWTSWPQVGGLVSMCCPHGCVARQEMQVIVPLWRFRELSGSEVPA